VETSSSLPGQEAAVNPFDLLQGPVVIVLFPLFMLVLLRVIAPHGVDLDEMLQLPPDRESPRGVDEEHVRWRVELLRRRTETTGTEDPVQARAAATSSVSAPRA
jgi:hypothetical protein